MNEDAIQCAGCGKRQVAKRGSLCFSCANGLGSDPLRSKSKGGKRGRPRKDENLRVGQSTSVAQATAAVFKTSEIRPGELLDAIVIATGGKLTAETLERIKSLREAS